MISILLLLIGTVLTYDASSRCYLKLEDKLYSLKPLQASPYYVYDMPTERILMNFCSPFEAPTGYNCSQAFVMALSPDNAACRRYSADSLLYMYDKKQYNQSGQHGITIIEYSGQAVENTEFNRSAQITVVCSEDDGFVFTSVTVSDTMVQIFGKSIHGCPVLEISRLWQALSDNSIIFGIVLFLVGVMELLFGRKMLQPTIFIAAYCLSFAVLAAIATEFIVSPTSPLIVMYLVLLLVLFLSSCIAYLIMGASHISIFCVGAWMGLIVAALANSIFIKMFNVYSTWSLVVFAIIFCLTFGLLSYKAYDLIIILSTSLTGAYMMVRPVSWIFGGFPNQFMLTQKIRAGELRALPSAFFGYLAAIIVLNSIGFLYQYLQLKREIVFRENGTLEVGAVQSGIQTGVNKLRDSINAIINKYKIEEDRPDDGYVEFQEFKRFDSQKPLYPHLESHLRTSERKSVQEQPIKIDSHSSLRQSIEIQRNSADNQVQLPQLQRNHSPQSVPEKPTRDSGRLSQKLNEIHKSGSRFSRERMSSGNP